MWRFVAGVAQLVRALDCGSRGPPFKPGRRYHFSLACHSNTTLCCSAPVARLKINMRLSLVTTAYQSGPWVKAMAVVPCGKVMRSGRVMSDAVSRSFFSPEKRMTNSVMMIIIPAIIVAVSAVTNRRKNTRCAGVSAG